MYQPKKYSAKIGIVGHDFKIGGIFTDEEQNHYFYKPSKYLSPWHVAANFTKLISRDDYSAKLEVERKSPNQFVPFGGFLEFEVEDSQLSVGNLKIRAASKNELETYFELANLDLFFLSKSLASTNLGDLLWNNLNPKMNLNNSLLRLKLDLPCMEFILDSPIDDNYMFARELVNTVNCFGEPIGFHLGDLAMIDDRVCYGNAEICRITFISDKLLDEFVASGFNENLTVAENFQDLLEHVLQNSIDFTIAHGGIKDFSLEISTSLNVDSFFVKALILHINKILLDVEKAIDFIEENSSLSISPDSIKLTLPHPLFLLQVPYSSSLLSSLTFLNDPAMHYFNQIASDFLRLQFLFVDNKK
ncbi:unnamed protein product [Oikopleura dioica]|uniref:Uncharacterized protein n=1 Tax=Oikopleura dioica TaxID=34765 RepID=E4X1W3_OIKDI|nr:unnamed protein product [Oikopleura dioica]